MIPSRDISRLIEIMAKLRTPGSGCPWDLEQNFSTIAPYTIEEAYEVADAIARGDLDDLRDELGDLLLQVVFHARMAEEQGAFSFGDVVEAITRKMIRRHPHVFADANGKLTPSDVKGVWDRIKAEEKAERAARRPPEESAHKSLLASVKAGQPALARALGLQRKASTVGFDWNDPRAVLQKIREEADEIEAELDRADGEQLADETGDLLFAVVNLARHVGADPEMALRGANAKFERRFGYIERALEAQGRSPQDATLEEMDALWNEAKKQEQADSIHQGESRLAGADICKQIKDARDRGDGPTRCGVIDGRFSVAEVARAFGLADGPSIYKPVNEADAQAIATRILGTDLAYRAEIMSASRAGELWQQFLHLFEGQNISFVSNTRADCEGWNPATSATFDAGVLVIGYSKAGCLWVEDED